MIPRILAALFGAFLFAIIVPVGYGLSFEKVPFDNFKGIILLAAGGAALGVLLGVLFPKVSGFIFEVFMDR